MLRLPSAALHRRSEPTAESSSSCCRGTPDEDVTRTPDSTQRHVLGSRYVVKRAVGQGGFATVHLGECLRTQRPCAIKTIFKESRAETEAAHREAAALQALEHRRVNGLLDVVEDQFNVYLILEYVEGQDLLEYLLEMGRLDEETAAPILRQLLQALAHCHQQGFVHRDIKPENLMVQSNSSSSSSAASEVTLVDFGLARAAGELLEDPEGTEAYLAPEALSSPHACHASLDMWSVGVVLFAMLTGELPSGPVGACSLDLARFSEDAQSLLTGLLEPDPLRRLSAREALEHPWVK